MARSPVWGYNQSLAGEAIASDLIETFFFISGPLIGWCVVV